MIVLPEELKLAIAQIKTLTMLRDEDIVLAQSKIVQWEQGGNHIRLSKVQDFIAVHIDFKLNEAIEELINDLK